MNLIFDLDDTLYNLMGPFELVHKKLYADKTDADCTQLFMQSRVYSDYGGREEGINSARRLFL